MSSGTCSRKALFAFVFLWGASMASAVEYFVATDGDDVDNDGLSLGAPFKTIQRAASIMEPGDVCRIRGGTYRETIRPARSGWSSAPITFTNHNGESVWISGLEEVAASWTPRPEGGHKATTPMTLGARNQLFIDGEMAYEARWPNNIGSLIYFTTERPSEKGASGPSGLTNYLSHAQFPFSEDDLVGASLWISPGLQWNNHVVPVWGYDAENKRLAYEAPRPGEDAWIADTNDFFYLFGARALLDADNEWWYDEAEGALHLRAPGGADPASLKVEVKARELAFDLDERNHVVIGGINLMGCRVNARLSNGIKLRGLTGRFIAHDAAERVEGIYLRGSDNEVTDCEITGSSGSLLNFELSSGGRIVNNHLRQGGYMFTHRAFKVMGADHVVSHNTISDSPGTLVRLEMRRGVFQHNHVFNGCWAQRDCGLMYNNYTDGQNAVVQKNLFHDNLSESETKSHAVYFDAGTSDYILLRNLFRGNRTTGLKLNSVFHHLVYNNTSYDSARYSARYAPLGFIPGLEPDRPDGAEWINNLATCANLTGQAGTPTERNPYSFRNLDPALENPRYVDATNHDLRLTSASPARDKGAYVEGVVEGYVGAAPDIGALEYGAPAFAVGHDFSNPPAEALLAPPDLTRFKRRNLVENGSFEYGAAPWVKGEAETMTLVEQSSSAENSVSRNGFHAARLGPAIDSASQTIAGLEPGMRYVATVWAKAEPGRTAEFSVSGHGGGERFARTSSTDWAPLDIVFTNATGTVTLTLRKSDATAGYVHMDLCALKRSAGPRLPVVADLEIVGRTSVAITNSAEYAFAGASTRYELVEAPTGATISAEGVISWTPEVGEIPSAHHFTTRAWDPAVPALVSTNTFRVEARARPPQPLYEGFSAGTNNAAGEYTPNPGDQTDGRHRLTAGQNPVVFGFVGDWAHASGAFEMGVEPREGLLYDDGTNRLFNSGNAVFRAYNGASTRALDVEGLRFGETGTVRYISFLMKLDDPLAEARLDFGQAAFEDWGRLGVRVENGVFNARFAGLDVVSMGAVDTNTHLFVWKVEFGERETARLFMDPVLEAEAANTPVWIGEAPAGTWTPTHLTLSKRPGSDGHAVVFDEIRVGSSWAEAVVAEVEPPEPDLLAYDGFTAGTDLEAGEYIANPGGYTDGRHRLVDGQNPRIVGFKGGWTNLVSEFELGLIPRPSLAYDDGTHRVETRGNAVFRGYTGQASRALDPDALGLGELGSARYFSFMMRLENPESEARVDFGEAFFEDWGRMGVRVESGRINARFAAGPAEFIANANSNTRFFVWKVDFGAEETATLYVDPVLASEDANGGRFMGSVSEGGFNPTHLTLSKRSGTDGDAVVIDEIRVGKTWASVTAATPLEDLETPYEAWTRAYALAGAAAEHSADPDGDGANNLREWALGGDPVNALDQGLSAEFRPMEEGAPSAFLFIHPSNTVARDLTYHLETSTNLHSAAHWTNDHYEVLGWSVAVDGFSLVTNRLSAETARERFVRLVIEAAR